MEHSKIVQTSPDIGQVTPADANFEHATASQTSALAQGLSVHDIGVEMQYVETASYSATVMKELSAVRTAMTANKLASNTHVALAAMVHALACNIVLGSDYVSPLGIASMHNRIAHDFTNSNLEPIAQLSMPVNLLRNAWPHDHSQWLSFLLSQEINQLLSWLAVLAASTFKAPTQPNFSESRIAADTIAEALELKPDEHLTLSDLTLFERCSKDSILDAVTAAKGKERAAAFACLPLDSLIKLAGQELDGQWLPEQLYAFATEDDHKHLQEDAAKTRQWADYRASVPNGDSLFFDPDDLLDELGVDEDESADFNIDLETAH